MVSMGFTDSVTIFVEMDLVVFSSIVAIIPAAARDLVMKATN
jgi:hypothetical protein